MIENVNIYLLVKLQRRGKGGLGLFREITVYIYILLSGVYVLLVISVFSKSGVEREGVKGAIINCIFLVYSSIYIYIFQLCAR